MKKCAVLTMVQNEPDFIKMWNAYYSDHFDHTDMYVIDHESDPTYLDGYQFNTIKLKIDGKGYTGHEVIHQNVMRVLMDLLNEYSYVITHDVDMLLVPDPAEHPQGLRGFIDSFDGEYIQPAGYNVVDTVGNHFDVESRPWLVQRTHWYHDWRWLDKVVVVSCDPEWRHGGHMSKWTPDARNLNAKPEICGRPDIRLLHLGWCCPGLVRRRWASRVVSHPCYVESWNVDRAQEKVDFYANGAELPFPVEQIPEHWKMI